MNIKILATSLVAVLGTQVVAHEGVKNPAVMARMNGMKTISENMKVVGEMAKGKTRFDVSAARAAMVAVAEGAAETPALFTPEEDDPKSEALPLIWERFDDFTEKANRLEILASQLSASIEEPEDLRSALFVLGENCKSCHELYKE
ncbi:MAG: cytochrome c [Dinoroseobacter sp.]|nr:cytochrome c [Dinoroseobacter sp.]